MINNHKTLTAVCLAAAAFLAGCGSPGAGTNTSTLAVNSNANSNAAATNTGTATQPAALAGSPTAVYEAAYLARKNKDIAGLKSLMSKEVIEFLTMMGQADPQKKQTLDEILTEMSEQPQAPLPETRNERINGDRATVEYLDETGEWQSISFIKEGGAWKLTIDDLENEAPSGNSNTGTKPNSNPKSGR